MIRNGTMSSSTDEDIYEVEKVIDKRKRGKETEYLVRWKGYSNKHDSWEPASNVAGCKDIIRRFNADKQKRLSPRTQSAPSRDFYKSKYTNVGSSRRSSLSRFRNTTSTSKVRQIRKINVDNDKFSSSETSDGKFMSSFPSLFSSSTNIKKDASRLSSSSNIVSTLINSASVPTKKAFSTSQANPNSMKIFSASGNRENVKQWLSCKVSGPKSRLLALQDHDYKACGQLVPKDPINYQSPETSEESITSAARKSTLRKGRVYQERLVLLQWRQNFVEIIFANTARKNGLTPRFLTELTNALDAVIASKCSVVVVNTVGNTFCGGLDVQYLLESLTSSKNIPETAKYLAESVRLFVDKLIEFQRLLIAVVQGPAINLGCTMLALFDIVYCSDKAWFWTPYVDMAQTPECCSSYLFPEILGPATAYNMLLNGAKLTANEAKLRGLVTEVFPHDSLKKNTLSLIEACAKRSGEAIQVSKSLIRSGNIHKLKQVNYCECNELIERWSSQDFMDSLLKFVPTADSPF